MKKLFISLLSLFALGVFLCNTTFAQTNTVTSSSKGVVVATVGIKNAKIISQNGRDFVISFDITNGTGAQPQIKYAVKLTDSSLTNPTVFDEKVYDETFSLSENSTVSKTVNYSIPTSLPKGTYSLWIESRNESGLMLGIASLGTITITDNATSTVEIIPGSCSFVASSKSYPVSISLPAKYVAGTKTEDMFAVVKQYLMSHTVANATGTSQELFTVECKTKSNFSSDVVLTPRFETRVRTAFGDLVADASGSSNSITIKKGTNNITFLLLPKAKTSQEYNLTFNLVSADGKTISNTISYNYVVAGQNGTIQNVVFDKTSYKAGDTANLQIFSTQSGTSTGIVTVLISDDSGVCSNSSSKEVSNLAMTNLPVRIVKDCINPKASVSLSINGNVLDSKDFGVTTVISTMTPTFTTTVALITIILVFVIIFGTLIYKKKHSALIILVLSIAFYSTFCAVSKAETYACNPGWSVTNEYTICRSSTQLETLQTAGEGINYCSFYTNCLYACSGTSQVWVLESPTGTIAPGAPQCIAPPAPPVITLTASPDPVSYGNSANLTWSASNDISQGCSIYSGGGGTTFYPGPGGVINTGPITSNTTFTVSCTGIGGTGSNSLTIPVLSLLPYVTISALSNSVLYNSSTTISWNSIGADYCDVAKNGLSILVLGSSFGSYGSGNGQLKYPWGVTTDSFGNIYVADSFNSRIEKFNSSGTYLSQFGSKGIGTGQFNSTYGIGSIAVDSSGNIYVADTGNNRIEEFNSSGTYLSQFGSSVGYAGSGNGQFNSPYGIALDSSGNIYVADTGNNRIEEFNSSGTYLSQFGLGRGSGAGQFNDPLGIYINLSDNVIYIVDSGNNRIEEFNSSGTYLSQFGSYGSGNGQLNFPNAVALDSSGNIYVADTGNNRIEEFNSSGTYLSQFGSYGSGVGQFSQPVSIVIDSSGYIYISDSSNSRIQKHLPPLSSLSGSISSGLITTATTFLASCTNNGGTSTSSVVVSVFVPSPSVTISALSNSVLYNSSTTISWSSSLTNSCSVTKNGSSWASGTSSSQFSGLLTSNTTFVASCTGNGGTATSSTTVMVNPILIGISIQSASASVTNGLSTNIFWSSTGADSCLITKNGSSWTTGISGSQNSGVINTDTTFTLTCTNASGSSASQSVDVTVNPTPITPPIKCKKPSDCDFIWQDDCTATSTDDGISLSCIPTDTSSPSTPVTVTVPTAYMSTCTANQNYVNKNTVWTFIPHEKNNGDVRWSGTNLVAQTTSSTTLNKIYTTVGKKNITATTVITPITGDPYVSACYASTTMKLDTGTGGEI